MFLSIATTYRPATDLGFLLMKHPDRLHEFDLAFGKALMFFPEANEARCEAALVLDIDPVGLVRGRGSSSGPLDQYVNDRPYAATSLLSVALNRVLRSAFSGQSRERPELAAIAIPLEIRVEPLPAPSPDLVENLFAPLGWAVECRPIEGPGGASRYVSLLLAGQFKLSEALSHLYVLIPTLDGYKHYWVGDDEVEKLVARGEGWLANHPARDLIARRYLKRRRSLVSAALARLVSDDTGEPEADTGTTNTDPEAILEAPIRLHDRRLDTVVGELKACGAKRIADLGCGEGRLIARLAQDRQFTAIFGIDASMQSLKRARDRLKLDLAGGPSPDRIKLMQGALTYRDKRWAEAEAAALVEVIEHLDQDRLPALAEAVFGTKSLKTIVVTTPNVDYNALFPSLPNGAFRHPDHRFEWSRAQFQAWSEEVAARFGFAVRIAPVGPEDAMLGPITQMAVFSR